MHMHIATSYIDEMLIVYGGNSREPLLVAREVHQSLYILGTTYRYVGCRVGVIALYCPWELIEMLEATQVYFI